MTTPVARDIRLPVGRIFRANVRDLAHPGTGEPIEPGTRWVGADTVTVEFLDQDAGSVRVNGSLVGVAVSRPGERWAPEVAHFPSGGDYTVAYGHRLVITAGATPNPGGGDPTDPDGPDVPAPGGSVITDGDTAPVDAPVALRRGTDGRFRPDRPAITERPTRTEVGSTVSHALAVHSLDPTPHPVYDTTPSLSLIFENKLI